MKTVHYKVFWFLLVLFGIGNSLLAQEEKKTSYLTVTTMHRNTSNSELKREDWQKIEKEYFEKVTMKNPYILRSNILNHFFTADNTEILFVEVYESWEAIDKAWQKSNELIKAAWPDDATRKTFFQKRNSFYTGEHSDEIYVVLPDRKALSKIPEKELVYYVRKSKAVDPKDGSEKEFNVLNKEFMENIMLKNDALKAYYTYQHAWGSKANEFVEVFVVDSLSEIEKMWDRGEELIKNYWKDEGKRKEFFKNYDKYFSNTHGDYIYRNEVGLQK